MIIIYGLCREPKGRRTFFLLETFVDFFCFVRFSEKQLNNRVSEFPFNSSREHFEADAKNFTAKSQSESNFQGFVLFLTGFLTLWTTKKNPNLKADSNTRDNSTKSRCFQEVFFISWKIVFFVVIFFSLCQVCVSFNYAKLVFNLKRWIHCWIIFFQPF